MSRRMQAIRSSRRPPRAHDGPAHTTDLRTRAHPAEVRAGDGGGLRYVAEDDMLGKARKLWVLGPLCQREARIPKAEHMLREALALGDAAEVLLDFSHDSIQIRYIHEAEHVLLKARLGYVYTKLGRFEEELAMLEETLELHAATGSHSTIVTARSCMPAWIFWTMRKRRTNTWRSCSSRQASKTYPSDGDAAGPLAKRGIFERTSAHDSRGERLVQDGLGSAFNTRDRSDALRGEDDYHRTEGCSPGPSRRRAESSMIVEMSNRAESEMAGGGGPRVPNSCRQVVASHDCLGVRRRHVALGGDTYSLSVWRGLPADRLGRRVKISAYDVAPQAVCPLAWRMHHLRLRRVTVPPVNELQPRLEWLVDNLVVEEGGDADFDADGAWACLGRPLRAGSAASDRCCVTTVQ
ncbi:hypothetical protein GGX14DRAFT_408544 [Mycena pura]|uniref:Uncharacterized protein n=1 Tax=Mycena pura TaxID=153505 RepID=A0AAD6UQD7_9AGAR|nr:hypothetical protein GGX14DRAFT_408544 [Mycena pura]